MSHITPKEHYRRHIVLHGLWLSQDQLFGVLPPGKQWQLHDYYHPTASLTEAAFLTHRTTAAKAEPSLPHGAGKGFLEFERHYKLALRLADVTGKDIDAGLDLALLQAPKTYPAAVARTRNRPSILPSAAWHQSTSLEGRGHRSTRAGRGGAGTDTDGDGEEGCEAAHRFLDESTPRIIMES